MNFLAGPLTRTQLPTVNQLAGARLENKVPIEQAGKSIDTPVFTKPSIDSSARVQGKIEKVVAGSATRPAVPGGVAEYFLPNNLSFSEAFEAEGGSIPEGAQSLGLIYKPALLAQARVRYLNRKYNLDYEVETTAQTSVPDRRGVMRWEDVITGSIDQDSLDDKPDPRARFGPLEAPLSDAKTMSAMEKDFRDWIYHNSSVTVRANKELDIYTGPQVSRAEFRKACAQAAREGQEAELEKVSDKFEKKVDTIVSRLKREQRELEEDKSDLSQRKMEEYGTHAETALSLFSRRKKSLSRSLSKRRMTEKAEADVKESIQAIEEYERQITDLEAEKGEALQEVNDRWEEIASQVTEISVTPYKKDILVEAFGVAWFPYYVAQVGDEMLEVAGFSGQEGN